MSVSKNIILFIKKRYALNVYFGQAQNYSLIVKYSLSSTHIKLLQSLSVLFIRKYDFE